MPGSSSCTFDNMTCPRGTFRSLSSNLVCETCQTNFYGPSVNLTNQTQCKRCLSAARCINGRCENGFDYESGCRTCLPRHYGSNCWPCGAWWISILTDGLIGFFGLYLLFSFLYLMFYNNQDDAATHDKKPSTTSTHTSTDTKNRKQDKRKDNRYKNCFL